MYIVKAFYTDNNKYEPDSFEEDLFVTNIKPTLTTSLLNNNIVYDFIKRNEGDINNYIITPSYIEIKLKRDYETKETITFTIKEIPFISLEDNIKYFELGLGDSLEEDGETFEYSMCIKGIREPKNFEEVNTFIAEDLVKLGYKTVVSITEISENEVKNFFDWDALMKAPVFE